MSFLHCGTVIALYAESCFNSPNDIIFLGDTFFSYPPLGGWGGIVNHFPLFISTNIKRNGKFGLFRQLHM